MLEIIKKILPDDLELIRDSHQAVATAANTWIINYINTNQKQSNNKEWLKTLENLSGIQAAIGYNLKLDIYRNKNNQSLPQNDPAAIAIAQSAQQLYAQNNQLNINSILTICCNSWNYSTGNTHSDISNCFYYILQQASNDNRLNLIDTQLLLESINPFRYYINTMSQQETYLQMLTQLITTIIDKIQYLDSANTLNLYTIINVAIVLKRVHQDYEYSFNRHKKELTILYQKLTTRPQANTNWKYWHLGVYNFCKALDIPIEANDLNDKNIIKAECIDTYLDKIRKAIQNMPKDDKKS